MTWMIRVLGLVALLCTATMLGEPQAQTADACADPATTCGGKISKSCLRLGAGALSANKSSDCGQQLEAYSDCLGAVAETCPPAPNPGVGACSAAEEGALWSMVREDKTCAAYQAFLDSCPDSLRANFARRNLEALDCGVPSAQRSDPVPVGQFGYLIANVSGLALDVKKGQGRIGQTVVQANPHPLQVWRIERSTRFPEYYYVQTKIGGLYLDVKGGSQRAGADVVIAARHELQVWRFEPHPERNDCFYIKTQISGFYLDVRNASRQVGGNIVVAPRQPTQFWCWRPA